MTANDDALRVDPTPGVTGEDLEAPDLTAAVDLDAVAAGDHRPDAGPVHARLDDAHPER